MPTTRENFHRPGRRVLALDSEWFEPSYQPAKGIRRIGVCVDTSGSIGDDILKTLGSGGGAGHTDELRAVGNSLEIMEDGENGCHGRVAEYRM